MEALSRHIDDLSPQKLGQLITQLKRTRAQEYQIDRIPRSQESDSVPLSFAQQRLWFLDQFEPDSSLYSVYAGFQLKGKLQKAAIEQSLSEIRRRHGVLRAAFRTDNGQPVQVIAPPRPWILEQVDLSSLPSSDRAGVADQLADEETHKPFNLQRGSLIRVSLLCLEPEEHVILFTVHHIVFDGWSIGILIQELSALCRAYGAGAPSSLEELPVQYSDFVRWQREWLQGGVLEKQLTYWKRQLADLPAMLNLPTNRPRPATQTCNGAVGTVAFQEPSVDAIHALSRTEGTTSFMTLLAAFEALLYRYTGQEDICVGTPVVNRNRAEIEGLIGFFVNTLVLRVDVSGNPSFVELLRRVRDVALGAYAHQDLPFEYLVEMLQPERTLSHSPLIQSIFRVEKGGAQGLELEGLTIEPWPIDSRTAKFDLCFVVNETESGLGATVQYNTDLFDPATINQMLRHFQTLVRGVVTDPHLPISNLPMLSKAEVEQLLIEWSNSNRDLLEYHCIHHLFEKQVQLRPDAIALVLNDDELSYRELNRRANQLAHHLQELGAGPEVLVGLCLDRSIELIVGILGVLKAGAAYVPLDTNYPLDRLAFMIEDAQLAIVLTQRSQVEKLPAHWGQLICLDTDWKVIGQESEDNPEGITTVEGLAYVTYTSGSTGKPKGTLIPHCSVNGFMTDVDYIDVDESQVFLQHSSISWDAMTLELWPALTSGGRCVLFGGQIPTGSELGEAISRYGVSVLWLTSSLYNAVIETGAGQLEGIKQLLIGGEGLSVTHVRRGKQKLRGARMVNGYGPSECTVFVCCYEIEGEEEWGESGIPIGRAIGDRQVYIMDGRKNVAPIGVTGEIYVGGASVARGYLGMAEMTAEKFVPDPFSKHPGSRLYKSGDLARFRRDGQIEFLGRIDYQVKVRGHRIELAEVEAELKQQGQVRAAVAVVTEDEGGEKRLVAYVVCEERGAVSGAELRRYLGERVPGYMVPAVIVEIEALPLSPNGKINRKALPAPEKACSERETYVQPRTPEEEVLAGIWAEVLEVERVGIHDNFFDLRGHSLLATQVVERARRAFQLELSIRSLFESPTVAGMAEEIINLRESQQPIKEKVAHAFQLVENLSDDEAVALLEQKLKA